MIFSALVPIWYLNQQSKNLIMSSFISANPIISAFIILAILVVVFLFLFRKSISSSIEKRGFNIALKAFKQSLEMNSKKLPQPLEVEASQPLASKAIEDPNHIKELVQKNNDPQATIEFISNRDDSPKEKAMHFAIAFTTKNEVSYYEEIVKLYEESPDLSEKVEIAWPLSYCLLHLKDYNEARLIWESLLKEADKEEYMVRCYIGLAKAYEAEDRANDAIKILRMGENIATQNDSFISLYNTMYSVLKKSGNHLAAASSLVAIQKLSLGQRNDSDCLFNLGLALRESGVDSLAVHSYDRILKLDAHNSGAMNNIALSLSALKLPGLANKQYNAAINEGESLAGANFANHLIQAGLYEQAVDILKKCASFEEVDRSVHLAENRVNIAIRDEECRFEKVLSSSSQQKPLLEAYGKAFATNANESTFLGKWILTAPGSTNIEIVLNKEGDEIQADWKGDKSVGLDIFQGMGGSLLGGNIPPPKYYLKGKISGATAEIKFYQGEPENNKRAALISADNDSAIKCYCYLKDDKITCLNIKDGYVYEYATLIRPAGTDNA